MSKKHQEEMSLLTCSTYGIPVVPLRFFNVYGPGQSLSNPYTGVVSIFLNRILSQKPPLIFEDGNQLRDFIHVSDVSRACLMALETDHADFIPVNIGTGKPNSVFDIAANLIKICDSNLRPFISGIFRKGDIRHCYADASLAQKLLKFRAKTDLRVGLAELVERVKAAGGTGGDLFDMALKELRSRKLA
jgi:dTDP-L-rhamnose 4-epimerase